MSGTLSFATEYGFHVTSEDRVTTATSSKGNQIKWRRSDGIWAKADDIGYEGFAEQSACCLLAYSNFNEYTKYAACKIIEDETEYLGCVSADFLAANEVLLTVARLFEMDVLDFDSDMKPMTASARLEYLIENMERITGMYGFGKWLGMLLEFDAFILNEDRHLHNIAVVRKSDGTYKPMPVFDNGAAFLSDVKRDYPLGIPIEAGIRKAKSKPLVTDFGKQLAAVGDVVGLSLKFDVNPDSLEVFSNACPAQIVERVRSVITYQARSYPHLFR